MLCVALWNSTIFFYFLLQAICIHKHMLILCRLAHKIKFLLDSLYLFFPRALPDTQLCFSLLNFWFAGRCASSSIALITTASTCVLLECCHLLLCVIGCGRVALLLLLLCVDVLLVCAEGYTQVTGVMVMMMTGRVLLVCALCVLWCGAGGGRCDDAKQKELLDQRSVFQLGGEVQRASSESIDGGPKEATQGLEKQKGMDVGQQVNSGVQKPPDGVIAEEDELRKKRD
ncbi:hypothetical protein TCSYLVIO_008055, partial [Trypanosoma cruzi]